jgi:TRAP-type C4-dicarboxylate transport system permease small subunit
MSSFDKALQKISDFLFRIFYVFITATFAFLLIILFINVIARNVVGSSIAAIEEGSRFVFTWMMFFGIAIGVFKKKHLGVEFLVSRYSPKMKRLFSIVSCLLMLILFATLTIYGFIYARSTMTMRSPIMGIRYGLIYLCIPFSGILSIFYCIVDLITTLRYSGKEEKA